MLANLIYVVKDAITDNYKYSVDGDCVWVKI